MGTIAASERPATLNPAQEWWTDIASGAARGPLALLETEIAAGRHQRSVYELFAEIEEKDAHLHSLIQTRTNGLLGLDRTIQSAGTGDREQRAAELVRRAWDNLPRSDDFLRALLDGLAKGFAAVELLWGYDAKGNLVPIDWVAHPQEYFLFDARGRLLLLMPPFRGARNSEANSAQALAAGRSFLPASTAIPAPPRKFAVLVFGRDTRNPYGRGLAQRCYWYYWFKKNNLKSWAIANEKYGAPTAVATYPAGTPEDERARLLDILASLQTDAGVVLPESVTIRLLESAHRGNGSTYRELADWCNDEMSKAVLGATLTSGEGRRSGSLALGSIHNAVRQDYIEADARLLASVLNGTFVRWIVELNMPGMERFPQWTIDPAPPADLEQQIRVDAELVKTGVPIPLSHFYARYGRPEPREGERVLRYDDSNLFQYHMQHGVLTVNEVRARLQLPAVHWGDVPTRPQETALTPAHGPAARNSQRGKRLARAKSSAASGNAAASDSVPNFQTQHTKGERHDHASP